MRLRDATELNNDGMIKFVVDLQQQTERNLSFFSERDLINDDSSFYFLILSAINMFFPFEKLLLNARLCKGNF